MTAAVRRQSRMAIVSAAVVVLIIAMALDTKYVRIGSALDVRSNVFSPAAFGRGAFPKVQAYVTAHAVDAATLAAAIAKDPAAAAKQYAVASDAGPDFPVKFSGKAGNQELGVYDVSVPGLPGSVHVSVQTGPAITGTDLRDATGTIKFGQFHNQIEYQNAGSGLNNAMKQAVLSKLDTSKLTGKTVNVVGVFSLSDPTSWVVTPVRFGVQ